MILMLTITIIITKLTITMMITKLTITMMITKLTITMMILMLTITMMITKLTASTVRRAASSWCASCTQQTASESGNFIESFKNSWELLMRTACHFSRNLWIHNACSMMMMLMTMMSKTIIFSSSITHTQWWWCWWRWCRRPSSCPHPQELCRHARM